jgi:hypothetical protein
MSSPIDLFSTPESSTPNSESARIEESVTSTNSSIGALTAAEDFQELSNHLSI